MKKKLRIVFMGTPDFAVATLHALIENNYIIVGVITAADKPAGRGRKVNESAVKKYALSKNLNVLQPTNLKNESFLEELKKLNANLQIIVAFRMLPKVVWQMPKYGTFNLHASLLPNYRGAAPIHWAIINGETKTGVTTFFIDEKIDTGEIIFQEEVQILPNETVGQLHDKLMDIGSHLVLKTVVNIENGEIKTVPQKKSGLIKIANKLNKDNCFIDWNSSLDSIYNMVRGLNPYPTAWCLIQNNDEALNTKIYAVEKRIETHNFEIGKISSSKNELKVAVNKGFILLKELKIPGKRKMDVKSLLNGYSFDSDSKML